MFVPETKSSRTPNPPKEHAVFVRNLSVLWRTDPDLAHQIDAVEDEERLALEPTRAGPPTARGSGPDGASVYLHSRHDPLTEAGRLVDQAWSDKFCFFVSGLGLGYHVRELCARLKGDAVVICFEPSLRTLATALACTDLSEALSARKLILLRSADKAQVHERFAPVGTLMMLGLQMVAHGPSLRVAPEEHARMTRLVTEYATYQRMSLLTLVANSKITCRNIAMNIPAYVSTPPIDGLRDRFRGHPAIVVSAGPSLRRNVERLAEAKGRAVIIAVQTTLRLLLERGIRPDFVTSLDFHAMSAAFFEGVGDVGDVHLVAEPKATWHVIDGYPGPVSLLDNRWMRLVLGDDLAGRDGLKAGATVAHLAFYLACYLGCDPVVFVGQDLAFTGHAFYVPGVEVHRTWRGEMNRFNTIENKEWERIARNGDILRRVPGQDGVELYTDELLFTYLEQFEKDISQTRTTVINATEGGAAIRGTSAMALSDVIERHCREAIPPERFAYRAQWRWRDPSRLPAAQRELDRRLAEFNDVEAVCDELLSLLKELEGLVGEPAKFNRRLARVDELRLRIHRATRPYEIVNSATQFAEFRRYSADRRLNADEAEGSERARRQIARDVEFISGVREGVDEVREMLEAARRRVVSEIEAEPEAERGVEPAGGGGVAEPGA
ncbi:MAG: hypothetical protein FLDDKLPJ_02266 [Phycisphaerae bacterium]|nr:hypothetical protein [Phycisphaerae bacterium]